MSATVPDIEGRDLVRRMTYTLKPAEFQEEQIRQAARAYLKDERITLWSRFFAINSEVGREEAVEWFTTQIMRVLDHVDHD